MRIRQQAHPATYRLATPDFPLITPSLSHWKILGYKLGVKTNEPFDKTNENAIVEPESWVDPVADAKDQNSTLDTLTALRADVHSRLLENQDYRSLVALDRAIADITGNSPIAEAISNGIAKKAKTKSDNDADVSGLSQADAAQVLLNKVLEEPVTIARLVSALNAHGIRVGGANPNINLSSVLSKDARFRSVRYKDRASWWISSRPFPGELDAQ